MFGTDGYIFAGLGVGPGWWGVSLFRGALSEGYFASFVTDGAAGYAHRNVMIFRM